MRLPFLSRRADRAAARERDAVLALNREHRDLAADRLIPLPAAWVVVRHATPDAPAAVIGYATDLDAATDAVVFLTRRTGRAFIVRHLSDAPASLLVSFAVETAQHAAAVERFTGAAL